MYKSEKGITLMVLVVTVLILLIIASATTGAIISTYKRTKVKIYIEEMELIREKMTLYEDKASVSSMAGLIHIGRPIPNSSTNFGDEDTTRESLEKAKELLDEWDKQGKLENVVLNDEDSKYVNYRFLTYADVVSYFEVKEDLENQGDVIIDTVSKKVYSIKSIEYNGKECHSVDDIRGKK